MVERRAEHYVSERGRKFPLVGVGKAHRLAVSFVVTHGVSHVESGHQCVHVFNKTMKMNGGFAGRHADFAN